MAQRSCVIVLLSLFATVFVTKLGSQQCKAGSATRISDRDGVTEKAVSFEGVFGRLTAHVFLPDTTVPVPGIAFSHSSIQYADTRTDLLPFARAIARAGAASIMLNGTIDWRTPNDNSKRPWMEVSCGAQWLMANVKLDRNRLGIGGPIKLERDPFCPLYPGSPCGQAGLYFNFGWTDAIHATDLMKTPQGQVQMGYFPEDFHLKPVKLEWLMKDSLP